MITFALTRLYTLYFILCTVRAHMAHGVSVPVPVPMPACAVCTCVWARVRARSCSCSCSCSGEALDAGLRLDPVVSRHKRHRHVGIDGRARRMLTAHRLPNARANVAKHKREDNRLLFLREANLLMHNRRERNQHAH